MHRFHPKHRYFMIDTGLEPGYHDPDIRMLYGCFNLFKDYYENTHCINDTNNDKEDIFITGYAEHVKELNDLYVWWTEVRPNRKDPDEPACGFCTTVENFLHNKCEHCSKYFEASNKLDQKYEEEDDEMMIRLMKVRRSIWYI